MATKKKPVPASFIAAAQAEAQAKYGPEVDAIKTLISQANDTYSQSKGQATSAAQILGQIARQAQTNTTAAFNANDAQFARTPGAPPPGPALLQALTTEKATRDLATARLGQMPVNAQAGANYQIAAAQRVRDKAIGQDTGQLANLSGEAGDYTASQIDSMLSDQQKREFTAQQQRARLTDEDARAAATRHQSNVNSLRTDRRTRELAAAKAKGKGSGKGADPFLPPVTQSNAQQAIESTIKQINSMFGNAGTKGAQTRQQAAHTLLTGSPEFKAYDTNLDPKVYPPGSHVDKATGIILGPDNQPLTYQIKSETGKPINKVRHARQITIPAVKAVKPIYVYAALDRLLYGGYRQHTVDLLHNAGIKVGNVRVVPDAVALKPKQSTSQPQHGGTF